MINYVTDSVNLPIADYTKKFINDTISLNGIKDVSRFDSVVSQTCKIIPTTNITLVDGRYYCKSIFIKPNGPNATLIPFILSADDTTKNRWVSFNAVTKVISYSHPIDGTFLAGFQDYNDGWIRLWVTIKHTTIVKVNPSTYYMGGYSTSSIKHSMWVWGAQFEEVPLISSGPSEYEAKEPTNLSLFYDRDSNVKISSPITELTYQPVYGSRVSFSTALSKYETSDGYFNMITSSVNSLTAKFDLKFDLNEEESQKLVNFIENKNGVYDITFVDPSNLYKSIDGYCSEYAINRINKNHFEIALSLDIKDAPNLFNWYNMNYVNCDINNWSLYRYFNKYDIIYYPNPNLVSNLIENSENFETYPWYLNSADLNINENIINPDGSYGAFRLTAKSYESYEIVNGTYSWTDAKLRAEQRGGRLAILNTEDKQRKIEPLLTGTATWIGGTDSAQEGVFKWIDGGLVSSGYTNWNYGEPNGGVSENYMNIYGPNMGAASYKWNDLPNNSINNATDYLVEYGFNATPDWHGLLLVDYINGAYQFDKIFRYISPNVEEMTISIYAKSGGKSKFILGMELADDQNRSNITYNYASFNLTTATSSADSLNSTIVSHSIESYPNGWYRCSITCKMNKRYMLFTLQTVNDLGNNSYIPNSSDGSLYLWGAQLQEGRLTEYVKTEGNPITYNKLNNFYYCTRSHDSLDGLNSDPFDGINNWRQDFFFEPDLISQNSVSLKIGQINFKNSFSQNIKTQKNSAALNLTYKFSNITTAKAKAILHFLENKAGYRRFRVNMDSVYNKPKVFYAPSWNHTWKYENSHDIEVQLIEDPMGIIYKN